MPDDELGAGIDADLIGLLLETQEIVMNARRGWAKTRELDCLIAGLVSGHAEEVPEYHVDIDAAMSLLDGWQDYDIQRRNGWYTVELYVPSREARAADESLPVAICKAMLLAAQRDMLTDALAAARGAESSP